jgi:tRNA A-37 threonylcarbamoyl transferase component Bud32
VPLNYGINDKMAKSGNVNSQVELFIQGKNVTVPFDLDINEKSYICSEVLRFLPGKRLVVKATFAGTSYVIKLFSNAKKGKRELKRELEGYRLALKANINLPQLEFVSDDVEAYSAIAYEFLELAQPFNDDESLLTQYVEQLLDLVFALHSRGLYQSDFHLDNLLMHDGQLFLIDLASVKVEQENSPLSKQVSFENLAMLVVQFAPKQQQILIDKLVRYFDKRGWVWNKVEQDTFEDYVHQAWLQRKKLYLKKCFRACTMTAYDKTFSQQTAFQRAFIDEVGPDFINNIDLLMKQGELRSIMKVSNLL